MCTEHCTWSRTVHFMVRKMFINQYDNSVRLSVAPMMDWTNRHCRYFHRLLSPRERLYPELVTSAALVRGQPLRLLEHSQHDHQLAQQLGVRRRVGEGKG